MAGRVANPATTATSQLRRLGTFRRVEPGTIVVPVPRGTTMVRFERNGGGGAGGAQSNNQGSNGGGEAQTERRFIRLRDSSVTVTIGRGGRNGFPANQYYPSEDSSALGYTAKAGKIGIPFVSPGPNSDNAQPGADGVDLTMIGSAGFAFGNFTGASGSGLRGGGEYGGHPSDGSGYAGRLGCGGGSGVPRPEFTPGGGGGDGYIVMEFYG
jgi:hypothetical protein